MDQAETLLDQSVTRPVRQDLRKPHFDFGRSLVPIDRHAIECRPLSCDHRSRGANFDTVDFPLNDRHWLKKQFAETRRLSDENQRLAAIEAILNRANPGPGGRYDDLGNTSLQPHLVNQGPGYAKDPGSYRLAAQRLGHFRRRPDRPHFGRRDATSTAPRDSWKLPEAWWDFVETRYETPLSCSTRNSTRRANIKFASCTSPTSDASAKIRLMADQHVEIHPYLERPVPMRALQFDIPAEATRDGELTLQWSIEPGQGGFSSAAAVAEVFLVRK